MRLKNARRLSASSQRWLHRQQKDPFVKNAAAAGYRSRAAYKLIELDKKFNLFQSHTCVVDLGAAPGGWCQVALQHLPPTKKTPVRVIGIDLLEIPEMAGAQFIQADFTTPEAQATLKNHLGMHNPTLILSDMAPATTGHQSTDHLRLMNLVEAAWLFAQETLAPSGTFVAKLLQGSEMPAFISELRQHFSKVSLAKPAASRKNSTEVYSVAQGFKGTSRAVL